jgi:ABC-type nitrate/sulfonate/bicarbonate transport system permease component
MSEPNSGPSEDREAARPASNTGFFRQWLRAWITLRKPVPAWEALALGALCVALCGGLWWFVTRGPGEQRIVGPLTMPSPAETFSKFPELFNEFAIVSNTIVTLRRVALGFLLAIALGVPLGVLAGCFPRVNSFLQPVLIFGRNIPLAAVLPILIFIFAGEQRKVMFIFIACVAFVIADTARAIMDVASRYVDTAYTLGASRWQTMIKVLVPLAMPTIFGSFRVLFGLAFGYIMLAESIKNPGDVGGLGFQINIFQRRQLREHIYLIILIIPLVALGVDLVLFWMQKQLFPHVYGGPGWLNIGLRFLLHRWEDLKGFFFHYQPPPTPAENLGSAAVVAAKETGKR